MLKIGLTGGIGSGKTTVAKVLEVLGGLLVAIPRTRRAGLLVLGPIAIIAGSPTADHTE